ncbi:MAG TPA: CmpA/NrtA family ABC transporter substrate-binding protein [Sulfurovum sp.]|jgi:nitrate/nitrite transport system substrate-binding protein|nr:MAG: nitrate ABC transporter [Sulfurovum sp. 35-42-20]OYZ25572.1 MAG: nitrate ABC transporter [Sulfurovum sp. 16-42-52]OYZ49583.1 MAG: nitrate ABC transporter [Sulfurovum sp. 24-42-9]OZA45560.1 MAG: nitrate ABC transporter [Sulfurovum sp. 17-42-90]OZA59602.1 MAG: nitrate ABC transporter [Sulfurovum sp. 39-42-12]HQR74354.1 CmpA/NrtA family ABC transporter substrate-binding protein [Sulfurovum sp.]
MLKQVLKIGLGLSLIATAALAELEKTDLKIGFIPLTDCAALVIAKEKGFFTKHGLNVQLSKEASWANVRDKMTVGELDASHMLAAMPIASTLGVGSIQKDMVALMALGQNGDAITVSNKMYDAMMSADADATKKGSSLGLKKVIDSKTMGVPEFGMTFPTGTHNYHIRYWMAAGGVNPDTDVALKVVPPPQMVANMTAGNIDGYCVGEPWGQRAVVGNIGKVVVTGSQLWVDGPEKVLGVQKSFVEKYPETTKEMIKAVIEAGVWLDASWENRKEASAILSSKAYVNAPKDVIDNSMTGTYMFTNGVDTAMPEFNQFAKNNALYPYYSHGLWQVTQMIRWGQLDHAVDMKKTVESVYRPDLFATAAKEVGYALPQSPWKVETKFIDGVTFDSNQAVDYIFNAPIKSPKITKEALAEVNKWQVK